MFFCDYDAKFAINRIYRTYRIYYIYNIRCKISVVFATYYVLCKLNPV